MNENNGYAWITKGREIENYIPRRILAECLKKVHSDFKRLKNTGYYKPAYEYIGKDNKIKKNKVDKVKVAREVVKFPPDLEIMDLKRRLNELINFIKTANDIEIPK